MARDLTPGTGHRRGRLRVYLGSAPGVGKTYRMLDEARRRQDRGADVVVGWIECHGRRHTEAMLDGLEVVPGVHRAYRDTDFEEMDLDAVLRRKPTVVLVDELAHTNVPGGRHGKRWQDVEELLDAGIDVITTVNIQHLESLNDVVQKITGIPQRETVPDEVVRRADQIELVDMAPQALRRRMAHGNVYKAEKVDAALSNYFRVGNLTALRELALLWVAGRVDEGLRDYRASHNIDRVWETRERVVVALTGGPEGETLVRRAARIADRTAGGDLLAVHVTRSDGLAGASSGALAQQRQLVESLGGSYHVVVGDDIPTSLLAFARAHDATQLVLGTSRRGRVTRFLTGPGIGETTVDASEDIDVHMVTHEFTGRGRLPALGRRHSRRRTVAGFLAGLIVPSLLTLVLSQFHDAVNLTTDALIFQLGVVVVALLGGATSALLASLVASVLLNYFFIPPVHAFTIGETNNIIALVVFAAVALTVSTVVDHATRLTARAARATAEAETLSTLAGSVLRGADALPALLEKSRTAFGMSSVALLGRTGGEVLASCDTAAEAKDAVTKGTGTKGTEAEDAGSGADAPVTTEVPVGADAVLVLTGRRLPAADQRVLTAFAAHVAAALERDRLAVVAAEVEPIKAADRMRTALLAAVSHDLRTPLAAALASVGSLRSPDVEFSPEDQAELLATADESLVKLTRLVDNLLDMSRLQAGALTLHLAETHLDEILPRALDSLADPYAPVQPLDLETVPPVLADPPLLERVLANVITNALRYNAPGAPVLVAASHHAGRVELRVIDRGPGIAPEDRDRVFLPFQRLGDTDNTTGVGLGLALSRGLAEAMDGSLEVEDTPGGGTTMLLTLPAAPARPLPAGPLPAVPVPAGPVRTGPGPAQHPGEAPV
ncbi:sensor histidine kinase [Kitasatospora purpeofusca]|uniref:sensor histidine kinase n=1 Tax=Kitasatospora purpeofusca TaxID=67352 RepID=UPI00225B8A65|nr:sensor histidine kinase KdpD [Kitasatospora purpeofusca]MCX4753373.1 sensor histidine kinase KdpD [Kitasatospora purpeofusca]WSR32879.1 sensor histidine kinase KdpD [Kitasatospora purpeofusca]